VKVIVGIDPGAHGALAFLPERGTPWVMDMPTVQVKRGKRTINRVEPAVIGAVLRGTLVGNDIVASVEQVGAMPGQGVSSMFEFGRSFGAVLGVLAALSVPVTMTPPQTWKRAMGVSADKTGSRASALRLWPELAAELARVKDDGRAEALLIAEHYRRTSEGA